MDEEAAVIARVQAGDREAFSTLVTRYQQEVWNLAVRMVTNREDARDVAQETFVRAYRAIGRFRTGEPFRPWLMRIASNLAVDRLRAQGRAPLEFHDIFPDPGGDPAEHASRREVAGRVRAAVAALPPDYRQIVVLSYLKGLSHQEIMAATGLRMTQVKNRLHRARLMLKRFLDASMTDA